MKNRGLWLLIYFLSFSALALTPEIKYIRSDVMPVVREAQSAFEAHCRCKLYVEVEWKDLDLERLGFIRNFCSDMSTGAKTYCGSSATNRQRMCQMKTLHFMYGSSTSVGFSLGMARVAVDNITTPTWENLIEEVDK